MIDSARFPYVGISSGYSPASRLAYLPILLKYDMYSARTWGLLDTGSAVNVLSYTVGLQLGLVWEQQTTTVHLTGNLARLPARAVILSGQMEPFSSVQLAFAWSQSEEVPVILGQVNFFAEFDVCFYGSQSAFEIKPKSRQTA